MRRRALVTAAALLAVVLAAFAPRGGGARGAGAPRIDGVDPARGATDATTDLHLTGDGFEPGSRVSLLSGGPNLTGTYPMPDGARSLEVTGSRGCIAFYNHQAKLGGIQILDFAGPAAPHAVGAFETGDSGTAVQVAGGLAKVPAASSIRGPARQVAW